MRSRALLIILLAASVALVSASPYAEEDVDGSAHMDNPDDEDFDGPSGEPPAPVHEVKESKDSAPPPLPKAGPTAPPPVFVPTGPEQSSGFKLDTLTIAVLVGVLLLVVIVIIVVVVCCRKRSASPGYTRGAPSNKAYI